MASPILVTGGTGTLGRHVVRRLRDAGYDIRVLSRRNREAEDGIQLMTGDLATGEGIEPAVDGAETIIHCAGSSKGDENKARNLVRAASRAGAAHLVYISVVGADRIPIGSRVDRAMFGYFGSKLAAERIVADSGLPFTTLRATQFHDLILTMAQQMAKLPAIPAPAGFQYQPIDAAEVAARLTELALGKPAGQVPDMGGPEVYDAADLFRGYLRATHRHRTAPAARRGRPCAPGRREPGTRAGRGPPDVGGVPGREAELKGNGRGELPRGADRQTREVEPEQPDSTTSGDKCANITRTWRSS